MRACVPAAQRLACTFNMCIFPCQVLHNLLNLGDYGSFYTGSLECGLGPGHSGVLRCGLTFPVVSALELNS